MSTTHKSARWSTLAVTTVVHEDHATGLLVAVGHDSDGRLAYAASRNTDQAVMSVWFYFTGTGSETGPFTWPTYEQAVRDALRGEAAGY